eukprot:5120302-Pleurochrysis_carterae.AAC.1
MPSNEIISLAAITFARLVLEALLNSIELPRNSQSGIRAGREAASSRRADTGKLARRHLTVATTPWQPSRPCPT